MSHLSAHIVVLLMVWLALATWQHLFMAFSKMLQQISGLSLKRGGFGDIFSAAWKRFVPSRDLHNHPPRSQVGSTHLTGFKMAPLLPLMMANQ